MKNFDFDEKNLNLRKLKFTEENIRRISNTKKPVKLTTEQESEFNNFIKTYMSVLQIPGLSFAVVGKDGPLFVGAYGKKQEGGNDPITPQTLFPWASITKSVSSAAVLELVAKNIIKLSDRIIDILPELELEDDEFAKTLSINKTLSMASGYSTPVEYSFLHKKAAELIKSMRYMKSPDNRTGEYKFEYSNLMYMLGVYAAARRYCQKTYPNLILTHEEEYALLMTDLVLRPLGMKNTVLSIDEMRQRKPALPHYLDFTDTLKEGNLELEKMLEPLGGSSVLMGSMEDFMEFVQTEIGKGKKGEKQIFSEKEFLLRRAFQTAEYGLGLGIDDSLEGMPFLGHDGGFFGYNTLFRVLPKQNIGFAIFINLNRPEITGIFTNLAIFKFIELLYGENLGAEKLLNEFLDEYRKLVDLNRHTISFDLKHLDRYLGRYSSDRLGPLTFYRGVNEKDYRISCEQWTSQVGITKDEKLVLVDPPIFGNASYNNGQLSIEDNTFVIRTGEETYTFKRMRLELIAKTVLTCMKDYVEKDSAILKLIQKALDEKEPLSKKDANDLINAHAKLAEDSLIKSALAAAQLKDSSGYKKWEDLGKDFSTMVKAAVPTKKEVLESIERSLAKQIKILKEEKEKQDLLQKNSSGFFPVVKKHPLINEIKSLLKSIGIIQKLLDENGEKISPEEFESLENASGELYNKDVFKHIQADQVELEEINLTENSSNTPKSQ